jgi:energy-coupling factor transport system permease protein
MRSTLLTRTNPLVLLCIGLLAIVASAAVRDARIGLVAVAAIAGLAAALVPGLPRGAWRLLGPVLAAGSVAFSTWLLVGRDGSLAATAGLRILVLALPGVLVAPLIDLSRLGDYLTALHLPARPVVAVTASLQRFEQLGEVWSRLAVARRARGLGAGRGPGPRIAFGASVTFGLLVSTLRESTRVAVAMDARGFARAQRRTSAEPASWTALDAAVLGTAVALAGLPYLTALM